MDCQVIGQTPPSYSRSIPSTKNSPHLVQQLVFPLKLLQQGRTVSKISLCLMPMKKNASMSTGRLATSINTISSATNAIRRLDTSSRCEPAYAMARPRRVLVFRGTNLKLLLIHSVSKLRATSLSVRKMSVRTPVGRRGQEPENQEVERVGTVYSQLNVHFARVILAYLLQGV